MFGDRNSVLRHGRRDRRRGRLDRAGPRPRPDRPRPLPLDRGAVRGRAADLRIFVLHHHLLPVPGTGPRAQRRLRRRRRDRVPPARGRRPRALGPQARAVRVAAREPVRRQHGHRLVAAPPRQHAALLQRDRGHRPARGRLAQVPVPRAGADHPVLDRDARVREVHGADRGRGDDARHEARRRDRRRRALRARRPRRARGARTTSSALCSSAAPRSCAAGEDYGVPLEPTVEAAIAEHAPEVVVDLSDEPVLGAAASGSRSRAACSALGAAVRRARLSLRPARARRRSRCPSLAVVGTGKRVGKTAVTGHVARLLAPTRDVVVVAMGRGGPPEPEVVELPPTLERPARALARRAAMRRPTTSRRPRSRACHGRLPALRRRARRRGGDSNVARGRCARRDARARPRRLRRQRRRAPARRDRRARARRRSAAQPIDVVAGYLNAYRILSPTSSS